MTTKKHSHTAFPKRSFPLSWLVILAILNIALRIPSLGHTLTWDEAWVLCSLKSVAAGGKLFLHQLWRHPPIYLSFGFLLSPLKDGFDFRMQSLSLGISTAALIVFISFISTLFGRRIALITGLVYTFLPGALLFDTWIKRDSLVTLFGTLALWAFFKRKDLLAGVFLGVGLLSKETAVFFAVSLVVLIVLHRPRERILKTSMSVFIPAILVSGWWYVFFQEGLPEISKFFLGSSDESTEFAKSWWYYIVKLRYDLGYTGLFLLAAGILAILSDIKIWRNKKFNLRQFKQIRFFPLIILLPAYLILTISHGKPSWMTISLYPYLALVIGMGWVFLIEFFSKIPAKFPILSRTQGALIISLFIILAFGYNTAKFRHIVHLEKMSPSTVEVMRTSYEISEAVNKLTSKGEKLMLMPMIYRIEPTMPDPIFYWHLQPLQLIRNSNLDMSYNEFKQFIVMRKINWVLLFPLDASLQLEIYEKSVEDINSWGYKLSTGVLLRVDDYWKESKQRT